MCIQFGFVAFRNFVTKVREKNESDPNRRLKTLQLVSTRRSCQSMYIWSIPLQRKVKIQGVSLISTDTKMWKFTAIFWIEGQTLSK
jgi:hypothetical protein